MASHATLLVRKHGLAKTLIVGLRIPDAPVFAKGQTVTIAFAGSSAASSHQTLNPGHQQMIKVPVPNELRAGSGLVPITVTCSVDYMPSRDAPPPPPSLFTLLHLRAQQSNSDVRHLGAILLYAYFE
jgi:hypothetical protein